MSLAAVELTPARADTALDPASRRIAVVAVEDPAELTEWIPEWEDLAAAAVEPNVFYEPWQILPALEAFGNRCRLIHLLVFSMNPATPSARPSLIAYFPVQRMRGFRGMPAAALILWKHIHCFLCTPLVRPGYTTQAFAALLEWARTDPRGGSVILFPQMSADGPFKTALIDFLRERRRPCYVFGTYERALFVPRASAEQYLTSFSMKSRKQFRRLTRRISELGALEFVELSSPAEFDTWVRDFLALEASGWKGRAESALACNERERRFFTRMAREAFRRGRLMMLAMHLNGRPVAMKCNLMSGAASFSFKIAFDEAFARLSPGVLLEIENIRRLHQTPGLEWMDSCAVSNHSMANRLWIDRRTIQTVAIGSGRPMGDFLLGAMPLMRWLAHKVVRSRPAGSSGAGSGESP